MYRSRLSAPRIAWGSQAFVLDTNEARKVPKKNKNNIYIYIWLKRHFGPKNGPAVLSFFLGPGQFLGGHR